MKYFYYFIEHNFEFALLILSVMFFISQVEGV